MASNITLTFATVPDLDDLINVNIDVGGFTAILDETFKEDRLISFQVTKGVTTSQQAADFVIAWNLDYRNFGGTNNLLAVQGGSDVIITVLNDAWQFLAPTGTAVSGGHITYVLGNDPVEGEKEVILTGFSVHVAAPCVSVNADIDVTGGNNIYDVYVDSVLVQSAQSTPLKVLLTRGSFVNLKVIDGLGEIIGKLRIRAANKILETQIVLDAQVLSGGTTITVQPIIVFTDVNPLTYSLNDTDYFTSNVFAGLAAGNFTMYVKDNFGCVTSKTFVLDGVSEVTQTVFVMSDINAIRYSRIENGKKNHKNTLSCNEVKQLPYLFYHRFLSADTPPTQFKTNAAYINAYTIDFDGNQNPITVLQETTNLGIDAKSTSTYFNLGDGRSALYFGVIDILDPITEAVLETLDFGFALPEWANQIGDFVTIEGIGEVQIDSIGYSDFYDAFILEFAIVYTGAPVIKKTSATYNIQPYEVYEFIVTMSAEPTVFNIILEVGKDSSNIDFTVISEKIKRVVDHDKLIEIIYYDSKNKGNMVYATGIKHTLRLLGIWDYVGDQETDGYDGDADFFVTNNTVYDSQKFLFWRLPGEMLAKMRLVVAHESLIINGLFYKLAEVPETVSNMNNNLKTFSVILKRSGDQFLTNEQEIISGTVEEETIAAAIEASKGKSLVLWTKING